MLHSKVSGFLRLLICFPHSKLVTTACKLSFLAAVEPDAYSPWGEVTGPDLDDNLVVDHRRIKVPGGFVDVHLGPRVDAVLLAQCHELQDGFAQAALLSQQVVNEDAWCSTVREQVCVSLRQVLPWIRPVVECGSSIVVVQEGHCPRRPQPNDTRRPSLAVRQPPVLAAPHCLLQNTFGCEIKSRGHAASVVAPIDSLLPVVVLGVLQHTIRVFAAVPVLS
mmetsp:Transcript_5541/g.14942  ORF Transcript_5541/g.14942 Transcript_5541/m.14942 type:complete len:221 (+) Transcript_5541:586-1248(+)